MTLLELIVVLVIIGLIAAVSTPFIFKSIGTAKIKTSTRRVASVLRRGRELAISQKKTRLVIIDFGSASFWLEGDKKGKSSLSDGVSFLKIVNSGEETSEGEFTFSFYPKGNSNGGEIYVKDHRDWGLKIVVSPILGKVAIKEFGGDEDET